MKPSNFLCNKKGTKMRKRSLLYAAAKFSCRERIFYKRICFIAGRNKNTLSPNDQFNTGKDNSIKLEKKVSSDIYKIYINYNRKGGWSEHVCLSQKWNIEAIHNSNYMKQTHFQKKFIDASFFLSNVQTALVKWCLIYNEYTFVEFIFFIRCLRLQKYNINAAF